MFSESCIANRKSILHEQLRKIPEKVWQLCGKSVAKSIFYIAGMAWHGILQ